MAYWNMYGDIFQVMPFTGYWAWGNGRYDIAGFVDNATMIEQFGVRWGSSTLAITYLRWEQSTGLSIEADIALNPAFNWTVDDYSIYRNSNLHNADWALLHTLGFSWGLENQWYELSIMNEPQHKYRAYTRLYLDDVMAIRNAYPARAVHVTDLNIALFYCSGYKQYSDSDLSTQLLAPGESFTVSNFVIENTGTTALTPEIAWYLVPDINSWTDSIYIGKTTHSSLSSGSYFRTSRTLTLPSNIDGRTYYLGAYIDISSDGFWLNNSSWLDRLITVNIPPTVTNLTITPAEPKTTDNLIGSYIYNDADGDSEWYAEIRWYKDGVHQPSFDNILTIPSSATAKHQVWEFTVKPHDGKHFGELVTSPVVQIRNTQPTVFNLSITPSEPLDTDDLVVNYTFSDVDGDSESGSEIRWYKNEVHQPAYDNLSTLPASATTPSECWHFTVKPGDGENFGTIQTSAPVPINMLLVIEAEEMQGRKTWYGNPCENGWRLTHQDQPIYENIEFPADFLYHFKIIAKGEIANGAAPWLKVQIGNEFKGTCEITSTEWNTYYFVASISAGIHQLSLTYLNDWWNPYIGDRNLLIDKVEMTCQFDSLSSTSFTFEAEEMSQQNHTQLDPTGNWATLHRYYSYVAHTMFFEQPELDFEIIAKADSSNGGWPVMELWIDNDVRSLTVDNSNSASYFFMINGISAGHHCIKIDFKNDSWASGRKLYIDKLIIHTTDGGLLKPGTDEPLNDKIVTIAIPQEFALQQNYPNPFNPETHINYQILEASFVTIKIFNLLGKEIRTLVNESKPAGYHTIKWDGRDDSGNLLVSGIYLYQIKAGSFNCVKKMALMK